MSHIFISYSKKNSDYARRLALHLRAAGFDVWMDDRIDYGSRWEDVIQKAIEDCAAFIAVMTPESQASEWVKTECEYAAKKGKPAFPLLLAGEVFFRFVSVQYVDVSDGSLPPNAFLDEMAEHARRRPGQGEDVTAPEVSADKTAYASITDIQAEDRRPRRLSLFASPSRKRVTMIGMALVAVLILAALAVNLAKVEDSRIAFGQTKSGVLSQAAPALRYTFRGAADDSVIITLVSEDFDTYLTLLDANGSKLAADDNSAGNQDSQIGPFTLTADGDYVIVVDSFAYHGGNAAAVGTYSVTLERHEAEVVEIGRTAQTSGCQFDWFFDSDYAVEGECPVSAWTEVSGIIQSFEQAVVIGIYLPSGQGRYFLLANDGRYSFAGGDFKHDSAPLAGCVINTTTGFAQSLPGQKLADEMIGCPKGESRIKPINFQVSDTTSAFVVYLAMHQDEAVYRLAAASSTTDEGEWQRVK